MTDYYSRVFILPDFPVYDAKYECVVEYYIDGEEAALCSHC